MFLFIGLSNYQGRNIFNIIVSILLFLVHEDRKTSAHFWPSYKYFQDTGKNHSEKISWEAGGVEWDNYNLEESN